jgi:predicted flap endonuclease-1-like 5' DNA nuclease
LRPGPGARHVTGSVKITVVLEAGTLAGIGLAAGLAGWWLRRRSEDVRLRAHEASAREQINAAGRARDRAREETQEIDVRLQRSRQEHDGCVSRIASLEALAASTRAELEGARARITQLEGEAEAAALRIESLEGQAQALAAVKTDLSAVREAHSGCAEREQRLRARITVLAKLVEPPAPVRLDGAPGWLLASPDGPKDDLQSMQGLGPKLVSQFSKLGIFHFHQLARMTPRDADWIGKRVEAFAGLNRRYRWAEQARALLANIGAKPSETAKKKRA